MLGDSDLSVTPICVGCWQFNDGEMSGDRTWNGQPYAMSKSIVDTALELGINFFDTAEAYLNSEGVVGRLFEGRRQGVVLASKFGYGANKKTGYTALDIEQALTASLERLRTDYLDLYQVHWPTVIDENLEEVVKELERQKSLGRIRYYGVSNFGKTDLEKFIAAGGKPITNQVLYNLLARGCEYEMLPYSVEKGISILAYSPLQQGLLSGKYLKSEDVPEGRRRNRLFSSSSTSLSRHGEEGCETELFTAIGELKTICDERNISMPSVSLSWLLKQKGLSSVIVGAASPEQITANTKFTDISAEMDSTLKDITEPIKVALGTNCDLWAEKSRHG